MEILLAMSIGFAIPGLIFGFVYPAIMAVVWILLYRDREGFFDFMKTI